MNIANILTILRLFLVPVFIYLIRIENQSYQMLAFIVFLLASFTDFLDGYLARRLNLITNFGKLLDPLADKILVFAALFALSDKGIISSDFILIVLSRDLFMGIFRAIAATQNSVIHASKLGKLKTVSQLLSLIGILSVLAFGLDLKDSNLLFFISKYLLYFSLFLTIVSFLEYVIKNRKIIFNE